MFNFFKKKPQNNDKSTKQDYIGDTKIPYEPNLINEFQDEHKILLNRFIRLEEAVKNKLPNEIKAALDGFSKVLRSHLLKENLKLYIYLKHATLNDPANSEIILHYQKEMQGIGRVVNNFVTTYTESDLDDNDISEMASQLAEIKVVLVERIENEEQTLYPLYMAPSHYL